MILGQFQWSKEGGLLKKDAEKASSRNNWMYMIFCE